MKAKLESIPVGGGVGFSIGGAPHKGQVLTWKMYIRLYVFFSALNITRTCYINLRSFYHLTLLCLFYCSDEVKQLAGEVLESIRGTLGHENFVRTYNLIRKNLKAKRDKRKREEKLIAVINPARHAKRKMRIAAKHRDHKRRKIMTMKVGRWRI